MFKQTLTATAFIALSALAAAPAFAEGDVEAGKDIYKDECMSCHGKIKPGGRNMIGPQLAGVVGRPIAQAEGFKYSKAMSGSDVVWDEETLATYLEAPRKVFKKTKMAYRGLPEGADAEDLIAYLKAASQ